MKKSHLLIVSLLLAPFLASAHNFQLQQRVAPVGVSDKGELNYANDKFSYQIARNSVGKCESYSILPAVAPPRR